MEIDGDHMVEVMADHITHRQMGEIGFSLLGLGTAVGIIGIVSRIGETREDKTQLLCTEVFDRLDQSSHHHISIIER